MLRENTQRVNTELYCWPRLICLIEQPIECAGYRGGKGRAVRGRGGKGGGGTGTEMDTESEL